MDGAVNALLGSVTQKTLFAHNFNRASSQASHVLTDLLSRYVSLLTSTCARYAEHAGRTSVSVPDALLALDELGISVNELIDYAQGEGREMNVEGYTTMTARRAEELALLKESLNEGQRLDHDGAVTLVYAEVPEELDGLFTNEEGQESEASDEEFDVKQKVNGDVVLENGSAKGDVRLASPTLPPSPISNPSSPARKRPRLSSWNPPSHIPDFLPPYPMAANGDMSQPASPQIKSEGDTMPPPPSAGPERERLPTPLPQQLSTATSAADYLTPVPYSMSSLSFVPETHLPDRHSFKKVLSGSAHALQLQPRKHPTPEITPALIGAYHHLLTNPPPTHPSTNPARHRVALTMLVQAYTAPRWTAADTLFGGAAAPRPRVVAPGPSFPVPIGSKEKDSQPMYMPSSSSRSIVASEAVVLPSFQPKSKLPDIARAILPLPVLNRTTRVNPPPPLINNTSKEKLLYGMGVPAPWNSNADTQAASAMKLGKGRDKDGLKKSEDGDDDKRRDERNKDANVLPDAMLHATWDWEVHDFRQPPPHHKRSRTLGSFSLHSVSNSGIPGIDGVTQTGGPLRRNSIKISKAK